MSRLLFYSPLVPYSIVFKPSVLKKSKRFPKEVLKRIREKLESLCINPYANAVKIRDLENVWRVRVGDYRILYRIENDRMVILVIRIDHRKQVYK